MVKSVEIKRALPPVYPQHFISRSSLFSSQKLTSFTKCRPFNLQLSRILPGVELLISRQGWCSLRMWLPVPVSPTALLPLVVLHHRGFSRSSLNSSCCNSQNSQWPRGPLFLLPPALLALGKLSWWMKHPGICQFHVELVCGGESRFLKNCWLESRRPLSFFFFFKQLYSHIIIYPFSTYNSLFFNIFTRLYNHHQCNFRIFYPLQ